MKTLEGIRALRDLAAVLVDDGPARLLRRKIGVRGAIGPGPARGDDLGFLHGHEMVTRMRGASCVNLSRLSEMSNSPSPSLRGATATKQSSFLAFVRRRRKLDCFAPLAMTGIGM